MIVSCSGHVLKNQKQLIIRNAVESDAEKLIRYAADSIEESDLYAFDDSAFCRTTDTERIYIKRAMEDDCMLMLSGFINENIVSVLTFLAPSNSRMRHAGEFGLTVSKNYRSLGIGSYMIDVLIKTLKNTHIRKINLQVRADNTPAISLYQKKGFSAEGKISRALCIHNIFYDTVLMGLCVD